MCRLHEILSLTNVHFSRYGFIQIWHRPTLLPRWLDEVYQQPGKTEDTVRQELEARGIAYPANGDVESALTVGSFARTAQKPVVIDELSGNERSIRC